MSYRYSIEYRRDCMKQVSFRAYMKESCLIYEWVLSHTWKSHVSHMNGSWHTHERVMSHIWMGPVTHLKNACHTYEWVLTHIRMIHISRVNGSCHTYEWVMSHIWMSHVTEARGCRLIHMCDMTHWYVWHDAFICVTWLVRMCDMTHSSLQHAYENESCHRSGRAEGCGLIHTCDMTYSCVWHDAFKSATCLHKRGMSQEGGLRGVDSFIRVTWLIRVCDMTHSSLQHAYINEACHRRGRAEGCGLIHMCDMTYSCVWHDAFKSATWLYRWVMPQGGMGWGAWTNGAALWKRHVLEVISFLGLFSRSPV